MARQSPKRKAIVGRVMHEFKHGEPGKPDGEPVKDPKQAIAIALHEAGSSNQESLAKARRTLDRTVKRELATRQSLYDEARCRGIPGRSKMSKVELERAVR